MALLGCMMKEYLLCAIYCLTCWNNPYAIGCWTCSQKFERGMARQLRGGFAARRKQPDAPHEIPLLGGPYDPHAPREEHAGIILQVARAVAARNQLQRTAPEKLPQLPLHIKTCREMLTDLDPRCLRVARYSMKLREVNWLYEQLPYDGFFASYADTAAATRD